MGGVGEDGDVEGGKGFGMGWNGLDERIRGIRAVDEKPEVPPNKEKGPPHPPSPSATRPASSSSSSNGAARTLPPKETSAGLTR